MNNTDKKPELKPDTWYWLTNPQETDIPYPIYCNCDGRLSIDGDVKTEYYHKYLVPYLTEIAMPDTLPVESSDIRELIEQAHMAAQADAGVDHGYSNAKEYYNRLSIESDKVLMPVEPTDEMIKAARYENDCFSGDPDKLNIGIYKAMIKSIKDSKA